MDEKHFKTWIYVVLSLLLLTTVLGCIFGLEPRSFMSLYEYDIHIQSDGSIENATFIIPLPVKNGTPVLGPKVLTPEDFIQENVTVEFTQTPPGLDLSGAETLPAGYDPFFVVIRAGKLVKEPEKDLYYKYITKSANIGDFKNNVNTLYPVGNESLIVPKYDFIWQEPQVDKITSTRIRYNTRAIPQNTWIYTDYQANFTTRVEIFFSLHCSNGWKESYDAWVRNTYSEIFSEHLIGPQKGWHQVDGELTIADGIYPNPENPEWQRVLNRVET